MVRTLFISFLLLVFCFSGYSQKKEIYRDTEIHGNLVVEDSMQTPYAKFDSIKLAGTVINEITNGAAKLETDTIVVGISRIIDYHTLDQLDSIVIFNNVTGSRVVRVFPGSGGYIPGSLNEVLLSDGSGGASTNTSIKWDASEGGLFVSNLSTDTAYLRHDGITVNNGRQSVQFPLGFHPTVGYYYQSLLRSSTDLSSLNRSQFRTYANNKINRAYIEVERNPNYLTQAVLDSAGMYLLGDFDTTKWVNDNLVTKRWVLDRVSSESSGGSAVGNVGDVQFSDGLGEFVNSDGISTGSTFNWDGSHLSINSDDGYSYFEVAMSNLSSGFIDYYSSDGTDEYGLYQDLGTFEVYRTGTSEYTFKVSPLGITTKQFSGNLTDGTPTASEIAAILGTSASSVDAGFQITIKDTDGTGLLYKVESDGTDWFYIAMTKAL